ncbi:MAG: DUF1467 family protein [Alphaproteobacteria bacterium]|nr:DUF1467 family protein [Alphaproteobacteria bacterium]
MAIISAIVTGIFLYLMIWLVVFLTVLPLWIKVEDEHPIGFATSAPSNPHIKRKLVLATYSSFVIWCVALALITILTPS